MASTADLLIDGFGRVREEVHAVLDGLGLDEVTYRPTPRSNSIGWLVWHLTRIQDDHISAVAGSEQKWTSEGWAERFGLPFEPSETGYGQDPDEVARVRVDPQLLAGYYDAVHAATVAFLGKVTDGQLDQVVDRRWNPPVTFGVRLVSVLCDDLQHVGQAAYVRGLAEDR